MYESFNNFYLTMNENGYIYVANSNSNSILYYLNIVAYPNPINFTINDNISIFLIICLIESIDADNIAA